MPLQHMVFLRENSCKDSCRLDRAIALPNFLRKFRGELRVEI